MRVIRCSKMGVSKKTVGNLNVGNLLLGTCFCLESWESVFVWKVGNLFLFGKLGTCLYIPNLCTNVT